MSYILSGLCGTLITVSHECSSKYVKTCQLVRLRLEKTSKEARRRFGSKENSLYNSLKTNWSDRNWNSLNHVSIHLPDHSQLNKDFDGGNCLKVALKIVNDWSLQESWGQIYNISTLSFSFFYLALFCLLAFLSVVTTYRHIHVYYMHTTYILHVYYLFNTCIIHVYYKYIICLTSTCLTSTCTC